MQKGFRVRVRVSCLEGSWLGLGFLGLGLGLVLQKGFRVRVSCVEGF